MGQRGRLAVKSCDFLIIAQVRVGGGQQAALTACAARSRRRWRRWSVCAGSRPILPVPREPAKKRLPRPRGAARRERRTQRTAEGDGGEQDPVLFLEPGSRLPVYYRTAARVCAVRWPGGHVRGRRLMRRGSAGGRPMSAVCRVMVEHPADGGIARTLAASVLGLLRGEARSKSCRGTGRRRVGERRAG